LLHSTRPGQGSQGDVDVVAPAFESGPDRIRTGQRIRSEQGVVALDPVQPSLDHPPLRPWRFPIALPHSTPPNSSVSRFDQPEYRKQILRRWRRVAPVKLTSRYVGPGRSYEFDQAGPASSTTGHHRIPVECRRDVDIGPPHRRMECPPRIPGLGPPPIRYGSGSHRTGGGMSWSMSRPCSWRSKIVSPR
jgi:hypothetical protein